MMIAALAALLMFALPLPAMGAEGPAPEIIVLEKTAPKAAENFAWYCVQCHGPRGDGTGINNSRSAKLPVSPRNLTDGKDMAQFSGADMERTITRGGGASDLSAIMPPWGNVFTREEILGLVAHVRKLCKCRFDPRAKERAMREAGRLPEEAPSEAGASAEKTAGADKTAGPKKEKSP